MPTGRFIAILISAFMTLNLQSCSNKTQSSASAGDNPAFQKATFAAGCFWHVESDLEQIRGVKSTTVGYTGGTTQDPNYKLVCSGKTGHAEAVQVVFDPKEITYKELIEEFFDRHDDHMKALQADTYQYRTAIFYNDEEQARIAREVKATREKEAGKELFVSIVPVSKFNVAEDYHQDYYKKNFE